MEPIKQLNKLVIASSGINRPLNYGAPQSSSFGSRDRNLRSRRDPGTRGTLLRTVAFALFVFLLGGCTSLQPVDLSSREIHEKVRAGEIAQPGERISVTTEDGNTHAFEVSEVSDRAIRGGNSNVSIDTIVTMRTKQTDTTKSVLAVAGGVVAVYFIAALKTVDDIIDSIGE